MDALLTPDDLAQALGLSIQTVYNRHSLGLSLPRCIKLGKVLRFRAQYVEQWLTSHYEAQPTPAPEPTATPRSRGRPTKTEEIRMRKTKVR